MSLMHSLFPGLLGRRWVRRALRQTSARLIEEVDGSELVRVRGEARVLHESDQLLTAPLSGMQCLCSRTVVNVGFCGDSGWLQLLDHSQGSDFLLKDETGDIRIYGQNLHFVGEVSLNSTSRFFRSLSDTEREPLAKLLSDSNFGFESWSKRAEFRDRDGRLRGLRVSEFVLLPNEPAEVCGMAQLEVAQQGAIPGSYREAPKSWVLRGSQKHPLLVVECGTERAELSAHNDTK